MRGEMEGVFAAEEVVEWLLLGRPPMGPCQNVWRLDCCRGCELGGREEIGFGAAYEDWKAGGGGVFCGCDCAEKRMERVCSIAVLELEHWAGRKLDAP